MSEPTTSPSRAAVTVRPMRDDDVARVGQLTLAAYDRYGSLTGRYRDHLADPSRRLPGSTAVLVAEVTAAEGPLVVGTVSYVTVDDDEWEDRPVPQGDAAFRALAVDPAWEGHGIGTALVDACFAAARAEGRHRMLITSMAWMPRAHELYERRYGFVRRRDLDVRFPSGLGYIYTCDLTPDAAERFPAPGPIPDDAPWFEDVWRR
jgi:ribosomal protein S18 acetylase RimI-like enzyme